MTTVGVFEILVKRDSLGSFLRSFEDKFDMDFQHDTFGPMKLYRISVSSFEAASEGNILRVDIERADAQKRRCFIQMLTFFSFNVIDLTSPKAKDVIERDESAWLHVLLSGYATLDFQTIWLLRKFLEYSGGPSDSLQCAIRTWKRTSENMALYAQHLHVHPVRQYGSYTNENMETAIRQSPMFGKAGLPFDTPLRQSTYLMKRFFLGCLLDDQVLYMSMLVGDEKLALQDYMLVTLRTLLLD
ncbi:MAG: hypothetical protein Q9182_001833 [Xanthomendoza sp. 2 TL-2023]